MFPNAGSGTDNLRALAEQFRSYGLRPPAQDPRREHVGVWWSPFPLRPNPSAIDEVAEILDPVLAPLGFARGQGGASEQVGQVIFCRGDDVDSIDGECVDLVVDLRARPDWRISEARYWGFPGDRWHLDFDANADLSDQLTNLARTLPIILAHRV